MLAKGATVDRIDVAADTVRPRDLSADLISYYMRFVKTLGRGYAELYRRTRSERYDALYYVASPSVLGHWKDLVALWIARAHVGTVVAHVHNGNFRDLFERSATRRSTEILLGSTDAFLFGSDALSQRTDGVIPAAKRSVVHNTVDDQLRCTEEEIEEKVQRRQQRDTLRVLYLSTMIPSKGYRDVAYVLDHLPKSQHSNTRLDLVGGWPDRRVRRAFEDDLQRNAWGDHVHVWGKLTDRAKIKAVLLDADVFVLPTYYPNEAQPFAVIEAMNAGTPIISTRHASIPEYVRDDENGYLVSKESPAEIASAIQKLRPSGNWTEKARSARQTYRDMFAPSSVCRQLFSGFRKAGVHVPDPSSTA
jgi:glycosyltransferase involved in cell wall biosynthesis